MKPPREVKIRILPDGKVLIETIGFVGESCVKVSKVLERALTGQVVPPDGKNVVRELKSEYYIQDENADENLTNRTP